MNTAESDDAVLSRHRAEKKDLQNKITGMKKQATKSKRKQVNARCEELEYELLQKHELELQSLRGAENGSPELLEDNATPEELLEQLSLKTATEVPSNTPKRDSTNLVTQPKKHRNRQKERIAKREAEIDRIREAAALEAAEQPDYKKMEQDALDDLCRINNLKQLDIQPNGHCLFASILDQMQSRHPEDAIYDIPSAYSQTKNPQDFDVYVLRSLSSSFIRANRDDFIPYLFDEATLTMKEVDEYTKTMEESAQWGGEVEILALAKVLKCCISVMMSGRATHKVNEDDHTNPELKLVYYKHSYALGEHYNSLRDL
ncbi:LANO_0D04720g1_1 [Lachancea nothofagi CBS 11611]|uniref:LANO_0D04720g1_1 n=1 Tax=Lachancea nothofagi CBS 11611 TaxID=1266666 RepID=A0A1G4JGK4_9SACH|nr:LANO_0D04720g1_1 [Lachancea nothofagi CBS 11611]